MVKLVLASGLLWGLNEMIYRNNLEEWTTYEAFAVVLPSISLGQRKKWEVKSMYLWCLFLCLLPSSLVSFNAHFSVSYFLAAILRVDRFPWTWELSAHCSMCALALLDPDKLWPVCISYQITIPWSQVPWILFTGPSQCQAHYGQAGMLTELIVLFNKWKHNYHAVIILSSLSLITFTDCSLCVWILWVEMVILLEIWVGKQIIANVSL